MGRLKSVGIDIGNFSIKVAEVEASGKNAGTILAFHEFLLNPDPRADRQLEVLEALRKISTQYDPANTRFIVGLPQGEVSLRLRRFPFRDRMKIVKSLAFELEDEIPLDVDDAVFEAKIVEYLGETAEVLTVAVPNDSVGARLELLKDGGFDPDIVTPEALALANVFERWQLPVAQLPAPPEADDSLEGKAAPPVAPVDARIVLDIGHERTLLLAYRDNALISARSIYWGGREIVEALAKTFNIPFLEAVKVLQKKSFILMNTAGASRDQMILSSTVSKQIDNLVKEVRLTLLDLKTEFNLNYTSLDLIGGVSQIQNLCPYLTQMLEVPANIYHHFGNHRLVQAEQSQYIESISPLSVGLAIEGLKKIRNPATNLRKGEFARQNKTLQIFWEKWRPVVITASCAFALFFVYSIVRSSMADSLVTASEDKVRTVATALELPRENRTLSGVRRYISDTRKRVQDRQTLSKLDNFNSAMDIIKEISSKIPVGTNEGGAKMAMDIKTLNIENDVVTIEGRVSIPPQVAVVKRALESIALEKKVTTLNRTGAAPGGAPFAFQFRVDRLP